MTENSSLPGKRANVQVIGLDVDTSGSLEKDWDVEGISMVIGITKAE
ncbi:MAG: hypothetical protein R2741_13175 [Methanolobus sp.]